MQLRLKNARELMQHFSQERYTNSSSIFWGSEGPFGGKVENIWAEPLNVTYRAKGLSPTHTTGSLLEYYCLGTSTLGVSVLASSQEKGETKGRGRFLVEFPGKETGGLLNQSCLSIIGIWPFLVKKGPCRRFIPPAQQITLPRYSSTRIGGGYQGRVSGMLSRRRRDEIKPLFVFKDKLQIKTCPKEVVFGPTTIKTSGGPIVPGPAVRSSS